jgi:hypothetical protein
LKGRGVLRGLSALGVRKGVTGSDGSKDRNREEREKERATRKFPEKGK